MKKFILLLLAFAFSVIGAYAQKPATMYTVPDSTTAFRKLMLKNTIIYDLSANKMWVLTSNATATKSLSTTTTKQEVTPGPIGLTGPKGEKGDSDTIVSDTTLCGYKEWVGLISQRNTDAPTVMVLKNTLGVALQLKYDGVGKYLIENGSTLFDNTKTVVIGGTQSTEAVGNSWVITVSTLVYNSTDIYLWVTKDKVLTDGLLTLYPVTIRIYE